MFSIKSKKIDLVFNSLLFQPSPLIHIFHTVNYAEFKYS